MWQHTEKAFDGGKVEVLINNAGVNPSVGWKVCLDVMAYGVINGSFMAREQMGTSKVIATIKQARIMSGCDILQLYKLMVVEKISSVFKGWPWRTNNQCRVNGGAKC